MKKNIHIVLVSPSDLKREREIANQVMTNINMILETMKKDCMINLKVWENVPPGAGRANFHIGKYLDIENSDIVIGVFWHRFGTPPGELRPDDGKTYLSGTEEELDKAFIHYQDHGKPYIMMYRKMNKPELKSDDDFVQYGRLIEFMRDCNPVGRHPAYYVEFESKDFEKRLQSDTLKVIKDIMP
jgi:hypothetical protein